MRTRSRVYYAPYPVYVGQNYIDVTFPVIGDNYVPNGAPWTTGNPNYTSYEENCMDELHPGPPYKTGGPFDLFKVESDHFTVRGSHSEYYSFYGYEGGFWSPHDPKGYLPWSSVANAMSDDWGDVSAYGPTGWNKFRPTRSPADLGVFLGEIREVPRMLKTSAKGFADIWKSMGGSASGFSPKSVANHFLNHQFGWVPFLNDLIDFYKVAVDFDKLYQQLKRDNGQWVKRGGSVSKTSEKEILFEKKKTPGLLPVPSSYLLNTSVYGDQLMERENTQNVWFEARFKYWIPSIMKSPDWNARAFMQLFGIMPSPALVWELTPWSWLIDWASSVGDAIGAVSSMLSDNLTAKYAYVMGTTTSEVTYTGSLAFKSKTVRERWRATLTAKRRVGASPFGFGLTGADFNARQWSILSALGLTRLGR